MLNHNNCNFIIVAPNGEPSILFNQLKDIYPNDYASKYLYIRKLIETTPIDSSLLNNQGELNLKIATSLFKNVTINEPSYEQEVLRKLCSYNDMKVTWSIINKNTQLLNLVDNLYPKKSPVNSLTKEELKVMLENRDKLPKKEKDLIDQFELKTTAKIKSLYKDEILEDTNLSLLDTVEDFYNALGIINSPVKPKNREELVLFTNSLLDIPAKFKFSKRNEFINKLNPKIRDNWKRYLNVMAFDYIQKENLIGLALGSVSGTLLNNGYIESYYPYSKEPVVRFKGETIKDNENTYFKLLEFEEPSGDYLDNDVTKEAYLISTIARHAAKNKHNVLLLPLKFSGKIEELFGGNSAKIMEFNKEKYVTLKLDGRFLVPIFNLGNDYTAYKPYHYLVDKLNEFELKVVMNNLLSEEFRNKYGDWIVYEKYKNKQPLTKSEYEYVKSFYDNFNKFETVLNKWYNNGEVDYNFIKELYNKNPKFDLTTIEDTSWKEAYEEIIVDEGIDKVIDYFKERYPNIKVIKINDKLLDYSGKLENGQIYINTAFAKLTTPIHEFGHIWLSLIKFENKSLYNELILAAKQSPLYSKMAEIYKTDNEEVIAEEVIVSELSDFTKNKIENTSLVTKVIRWIKDFFLKIFGFQSTADKDTLILRNLIKACIPDFIKGSNITSEEVDKLINYVYFEKLPKTLDISNEGVSLFTFISGKETIKDEHKQLALAENILNKKFNYNEINEALNENRDAKIFLSNKDYELFKNKKFDNRITLPYRVFVTDGKLNLALAKNFVKEYLVQQSNERLIKSVNDLVKYADKNIFKNLNTSKDLETVIYKYSDLAKLEKYKHLYNEKLDDPGLVVAINKGYDIDNNIVEYFDIVVVTPDPLDNTNKGDKSLFNTDILKESELKGVGTFGLSLRNNSYNQAALKGSLLYAYLLANNQKVNDITVTNNDLKKYPDTYKVLPHNFLLELKDFLSSEKVKSVIDKPSNSLIKDLFYNKDGSLKEFIANPDKYTMSNVYKLVLSSLYKENDTLKGYVADYIKDPSEENYDKLVNLIETKLNTLAINHKNVEEHPEFQLLSAALFELQTPINYSNFKLMDISTIEKYTTAMNGVTDPFLAWWIREWKKSKGKINIELRKAVEKNRKEFEKLRKSKDTSSDLIYLKDEKYFENILYKEEKIVDGKPTVIYYHRLVTENDPQWSKLTKEEREYATYVKNRIKELFINWFVENKLDSIDLDELGNSTPEEAAELFYETSVFAEGYLPFVKASTTEILNRGLDSSISTAKSRYVELLSGDYRYLDSSKDLEKIPQYLFEMGLNENKARYFKQLGFNEELDLDEDRELAFKHQNQLSRNVVDMLNRLEIQYLAQKYQTPLLLKWKAAKSLIIANEKAANINAQTGNDTPNAIELLDSLVHKVLFFKEKSLGESPKEKKVTQILSALAGLTSVTFLGFNFLANLANFSSMLTNILLQTVAEEQNETRPTKEEQKKMVSDFLEMDFDKLYAIGRVNGVIHFDMYDLVNSRRLTGKVKSLVDHKNLFVLDQLGDEFLRLFQMYIHMKQDGVWDAIEYKNGEVRYVPEKDKRPKAIIEEVMKNNKKDFGDAYLSPYDLNLRLRLERKITKKVGGYKEGDMTMAGMFTVGRAMTQFRKYMMVHVENAIKDNTINPNSIYYDITQDGKLKVVADKEEGHFTTLAKIYAKFSSLEKMSLAELKRKLTPEELTNIYKMIYYVVATAVSTLVYSLAFKDDDEEINWLTGKSSKYDGFATRIYHAIQSEINMLNSMDGKFSVLQNPLTLTSFVVAAKNILVSLLNGNSDRALEMVNDRIGLVKATNNLIDLINQENLE